MILIISIREHGYGPQKWYHSDGPYNEDLRQYECVLFYVDGLYRDKVTFEVEYEMYNASFRYNDCSELYLAMYSCDTIKYLDSFKGQILFANKDMPSKGNFYAHTYGTNATKFPFTLSTTKNPGYHTFSFELDESDLKFKPYNQYMEFALVSYGDDKHSFTEYASINDYYNDDVLSELILEHIKYEDSSKNFAKLKLIIFIIALAGSIAIICYVLNKKKSIKKKYNFYEPTMQMDYFRDIPSNLDPVFAATLAFCKDNKKPKEADIYSSILLSLARKDYIELIKVNNSNDVRIIVKYKPTQLSESPVTQEKIESLTPSEAHYFNLIIRHSKGQEISMNTFRQKVASDYTNTDSFVKAINNIPTTVGTTEGYFQQSKYDLPKQRVKSLSNTYMVLGILAIILLNIIIYQTPLDLAFGSFFVLGITLILSAIYLRKISKNFILLTQFGEDEYVKWNGLYRFLNSETLMSERTVIELPIWEQYLVYATAFGISDKVIAALKIRCPDLSESPMLRNSYYRSTHFHHSLGRSFTTSTHSAVSTSRFGSGGYGGYGGGGRGGGGGRRRTLIYKQTLN